MSGADRDAKFIDSFTPARLMARDEEDLKVISALLQDAATLAKDVAWLPKERRFAFVANRYRWEAPEAEERVRTGVHFDGVERARVRGLDPKNGDRTVTILSLSFEPAEEPPGGVLHVVCAPDLETGAEVEIALHVEAIEAGLADMTRPWAAKGRPAHEVGADEDESES